MEPIAYLVACPSIFCGPLKSNSWNENSHLPLNLLFYSRSPSWQMAAIYPVAQERNKPWCYLCFPFVSIGVFHWPSNHAKSIVFQSLSFPHPPSWLLFMPSSTFLRQAKQSPNRRQHSGSISRLSGPLYTAARGIFLEAGSPPCSHTDIALASTMNASNGSPLLYYYWHHHYFKLCSPLLGN